MDRRVTLKDVAARAGVSYQTVSKVINGTYRVPAETEARIWTSIGALNFVPDQHARNLRVHRSQMIGYSWQSALPDEASSHVMDDFLTAMVEEADAAGYHLLPFSHRAIDRHVDDYRRLIGSGRVDGFVLSSIDYADSRLDYLLETGFPFIAFGRSDLDRDFPWVDVDGALGLQLAVDHLAARGHRRIAMLGWLEGSRVGDDRLRGYLDAMRSHGLAVQPDLIARGKGTFEFGRGVAARWLDRPAAERPTAIVTVSDALAIGAMDAGRTRELLIGRDLAVVGFDDTPMSEHLWPPLTTIRQPLREAGHRCIEILTGLIEGEPVANCHVLVAPELIVRQSS